MSSHRQAPYGEWVEMYRRGISARKIAEVVRAPGSTVRYHLRLATAANPALRQEHRASVKPVRKVGDAGLANLAAIVALYNSEGRLPSSKSTDRQERTLASWLLRRRQDHDAGTLAREYREGLLAIPGWQQMTRKAADEGRWEMRLEELIHYRAAGNDWPRHKARDAEGERVLGVWLQYQRTKLAAGQLEGDKVERMDEDVPGWRVGRTHGRKKR